MGRRLRDLAGQTVALSADYGVPIPYRERYVLLALANALKDNPGQTWTSDARMAVKLGMSTDAYYRARRNLIAWGLMIRVDGGGQGASNNRYQLFPSAPTAEDASGETAEVDSLSPDGSSADTPVTSADTTTTSADTPVTSAGSADISLTIPYKPESSPTPYGAPALLSQHRNRDGYVSQSSDSLLASVSEDADERIRVRVATLREAR